MLVPDVVHQPTYHNPFPQLARVAIVPFYNLSTEPSVHQDEVAIAYYNELQKIPGFEVVPVGVTKRAMLDHQLAGNSPEDFRRLAQILNVDVVLVGAVTEYSPYYPPRLGLAVNWYAANPCFHPIPPGYGLPWGTSQEEYIPQPLVDEAEFALARAQLRTQTPGAGGAPATVAALAAPAAAAIAATPTVDATAANESTGTELPADWPDPTGFIPEPPSNTRPTCQPQSEPIITHVRIYHGNDAKFTAALEQYHYLQDEARFGGWQGYLQRSEDFLRFCCHLHLTETLAARGGAGKSEVVWRWPIGRYER